MAYDSSAKKAIVFGGLGTNGDLNDTWAYDPQADAWTEIKPTGPLPYPRFDAGMVYSPGTDRVVLYGGGFNEGSSGMIGTLDDTWVFDNHSWTLVATVGAQPPRRAWHGIACSPIGGEILIFGGGDANGEHNDTWSYIP